MDYNELFQKATISLSGKLPITPRTIFENNDVQKAAIEELKKQRTTNFNGSEMTWKELEKKVKLRNRVNDLEEMFSMKDLIEKLLLPSFLFPKIEEFLSDREYIDDKEGDQWHRNSQYAFCVMGDEILLFNGKSVVKETLTKEEKSYYLLWKEGVSKLFPSMMVQKHSAFILGE